MEHAVVSEPSFATEKLIAMRISSKAGILGSASRARFVPVPPTLVTSTVVVSTTENENWGDQI